MIRNKPSQQYCDDVKLIAVLNDGDQAAQHQEVVEHIEQCSRCQQRFDELAAGAQDWTKARQALLNDDPCSENRVGSAKWDYSLRSEGPVAWTESMASQLLSPASHPELLGRIGRYEVERLIGSGGMGVVFKAHDSELNRPVAIKILAPYLSSSGPARKRFAREARAAAAVVHEHVVPIYNVETERETPFLVMHYIAGESLQGRIDREGTLELCEILRIGMQVASGLSAAHQQGLVHRDIKPSNILMEQGVERALITDFGLARAADDASLTRTGFHPGTPQYMSPEQAAGEQVDARSDLFSLGSVLYTMCTGRPPFRAETSLGVLRRITDVEPRPIREINPNIPEWLCLLISRLMAKSPDARFGNALEVAALLEQCLAHVQQPTTAPLPAPLVPHAATGRRSVFSATRKGVIAMLGTIGMTLLGMVLWQATEPPDISGQWTSDEWGTVVLEAKGPGEYEGTFSGSGKNKPDTDNRNSRIIGVPGGTVLLGDPQNAFGSTGTVDLKSVLQSIAEADSDNDGIADDVVLGKTRSGTLHLKWSRLERRFNGTWGNGDQRKGTMSLRLVDNEIRGACTTDEDVQLESGTPLLGDLLWKRSVVTVPDGGNVLLGGTETTDEAANTPRKLSPGEILVEVYGGRGIWKSQEKQNEVGKLLLSLKAVKGVTVDIREDGEGDSFTKAVVHMPAHAGEGEKGADSTKQEASTRSIKIAIDEALRTHRVPDVRWLDGIGKQQYFPADKMPAQPTNSAIPARVKYFTAGDGKKIACSPDGKLIAVANGGKALPVAEGWKRTVEILDAETGKTAVSIPLTNEDEDALLAATEGPRDFEVGALAFSPDGRLLAVGTTLGQVKLFESRTGKLVLSLDDEAARLADQKTPEKLKSLKRAMGSVGSLAFSPDGLLMATSGGSFEDAAPNWGGVHELGRLATGPGRLKVWGVQSGELRNDLVGHSHANAVAFSPNGTYLASVGSWQGGGGSDHDGSGVILWAPNTGIKLRTFPVNTNGGTWSVAFSPKGKLVAISSRTFDKDNDTSTSSISLLRTATGILEWKQTVSGWGHPVAFSPDGKSVGVLCGGDSIRFFDTETGTLKHNLGLADPSQGARWNDFALLSQGRLAIAGVDNARQGTVEIWDFTGRNPSSIDLPPLTPNSLPKRNPAEDPSVIVPANERPLDRKNARSVVEAWVAAVIAKDVTKASSLAKHHPARADQIEAWGNHSELSDFSITKVATDEQSSPPRAIAISSMEVRLTPRHVDEPAASFLIFYLKRIDDAWFITNVDLSTSVEKTVKHFMYGDADVLNRGDVYPPSEEADPNAIDIPPQVNNTNVPAIEKPLDRQNALVEALLGTIDKVESYTVPDENGIYWSEPSIGPEHQDQWLGGLKVISWPNMVNRKLVVKFVIKNNARETRDAEINIPNSVSIEHDREDLTRRELILRNVQTRGETRTFTPGEVIEFPSPAISADFADTGLYNLRCGGLIAPDVRTTINNPITWIRIPLNIRLPMQYSVLEMNE